MDGIPQSVVAKALPTLGPLLVRLYNTSLDVGIFREAWKRAQLIPLKKKPVPSSSSDFRPIAWLCFLSKVLEKLIHDQLVEYITQKGLLDPLQAGFRQHHSTATALLKLTEDIQDGLDKHMATIAFMFDFSKAFDTLSPSLLLHKLSSMGLSRSALCWLHSYLCDRKQHGGLPHWAATNMGVPQGSVLGPLLFCLYINDVKNLFTEGIGHVLYADDLQVYIRVPHDEIEIGIARLSEVARRVQDWAKGAGLFLLVRLRP